MFKGNFLDCVPVYVCFHQAGLHLPAAFCLLCSGIGGFVVSAGLLDFYRRSVSRLPLLSAPEGSLLTKGKAARCK